MSELNVMRVTDIKVTRKQRKDYMYITVVTTSEDYNGLRKIDTQNYMSKDKKIKFKVEKILKENL